MYSGCFDVRGQFQNFGFSGLSMWRSAASSISACGESQTGHILTINQGATRGKYAPVCESASDVSSNHDFVSAGFGRLPGAVCSCLNLKPARNLSAAALPGLHFAHPCSFDGPLAINACLYFSEPISGQFITASQKAAGGS